MYPRVGAGGGGVAGAGVVVGAGVGQEGGDGAGGVFGEAGLDGGNSLDLHPRRPDRQTARPRPDHPTGNPLRPLPAARQAARLPRAADLTRPGLCRGFRPGHRHCPGNPTRHRHNPGLGITAPLGIYSAGVDLNDHGQPALSPHRPARPAQHLQPRPPHHHFPGPGPLTGARSPAPVSRTPTAAHPRRPMSSTATMREALACTEKRSVAAPRTYSGEQSSRRPLRGDRYPSVIVAGRTKAYGEQPIATSGNSPGSSGCGSVGKVDGALVLLASADAEIGGAGGDEAVRDCGTFLERLP